MPVPTMTAPPLTTPATSIRLPRALAMSVPELATVPLTIGAATAQGLDQRPQPILPPLTFSTPWLMALTMPPETVAPSRSTWAPEPEAKTTPLAVFVIVTPETMTAALVPSASMVFEFSTLLSMASRPVEVASRMPALMT